MKYTNKNNPIAKQLGDSKYRSRVVPNKKKNHIDNWLEEWEDAETEQDTRTDKNIQLESED